MAAVVAKVLSMDAEIDAATNHFIDDIIVNAGLVDIDRVMKHLERYGLQSNPPEEINNARVLGLQLRQVPGTGLC